MHWAMQVCNADSAPIGKVRLLRRCWEGLLEGQGTQDKLDQETVDTPNAKC